MAAIQTVSGPIDASELGVCYGHEHLIARPPESDDADFVLDDEEAAVGELLRFRHAGGAALVEMSTPDYGRDAPALRRLSERTGVHIVCATGFNKDRYCRRYVDGRSVDELADLFVTEIEDGIMEGARAPSTGESAVRAGLVKASSTLEEISPLAEAVFRAAAQTHRRTGAPISTHTEAGTMALEQLRLLEAEGVSPERVVVGHMDRKLDLPYHLEVAATGAFLGFDQISKEKYDPDTRRADVIARLTDEGYGGQILLGSDLARRSYWPAYGDDSAPGFTYILDRFVPTLRQAGLTEVGVRRMLIENPARAFAFAAPLEASST